jgi:ATP-dependent DNA ligase
VNCCFSLVLPVDHALANNFDAATMSAIGPKQTCASALHMSAFGGKADMKHTSRDFGIGAWRVRNSRGRPTNAPAAFIPPCQPSVAQRPPSGPGWAHELKHDGYRLQLHVRDGRVRLYTMNGNDWTKRYSRIVEEASRIKGTAILDAEVVCLSPEGVADFDRLTQPSCRRLRDRARLRPADA